MIWRIQPYKQTRDHSGKSELHPLSYAFSYECSLTSMSHFITVRQTRKSSNKLAKSSARITKYGAISCTANGRIDFIKRFQVLPVTCRRARQPLIRLEGVDTDTYGSPRIVACSIGCRKLMETYKQTKSHNTGFNGFRRFCW